MKVFYINLEHRKDRREHIESELNRLQLNGVRVNAIKKERGALGCCLSHLKILQECINCDNNELIMVLEDDAQFLIDRPTLNNMLLEFKNNTEASILCLGFNNLKPTIKSGPLLERSINTQTTSCYVVKTSFLPILIKSFQESANGLTKRLSSNNFCIDIYWKKLQQKYVFLIPKQRAVKQIESYSDILKRVTKYKV